MDGWVNGSRAKVCSSVWASGIHPGWGEGSSRGPWLDLLGLGGVKGKFRVLVITGSAGRGTGHQWVMACLHPPQQESQSLTSPKPSKGKVPWESETLQ